jgi:hypothetical protein
VRTSNGVDRPADLEQLAREAAAAICKEIKCERIRQAWRASHLVRSAGRRRLSSGQRADPQPLRQRKYGAPSVKVGKGRRFHRSDLDAWIRAGGVLAFKRAEG